MPQLILTIHTTSRDTRGLPRDHQKLVLTKCITIQLLLDIRSGAYNKPDQRKPFGNLMRFRTLSLNETRGILTISHHPPPSTPTHPINPQS